MLRLTASSFRAAPSDMHAGVKRPEAKPSSDARGGPSEWMAAGNAGKSCASESQPISRACVENLGLGFEFLL